MDGSGVVGIGGIEVIERRNGKKADGHSRSRVRGRRHLKTIGVGREENAANIRVVERAGAGRQAAWTAAARVQRGVAAKRWRRARIGCRGALVDVQGAALAQSTAGAGAAARAGL